jgi:hypothetical protein
MRSQDKVIPLSQIYGLISSMDEEDVLLDSKVAKQNFLIGLFFLPVLWLVNVLKYKEYLVLENLTNELQQTALCKISEITLKILCSLFYLMVGVKHSLVGLIIALAVIIGCILFFQLSGSSQKAKNTDFMINIPRLSLDDGGS